MGRGRGSDMEPRSLQGLEQHPSRGSRLPPCTYETFSQGKSGGTSSHVCRLSCEQVYTDDVAHTIELLLETIDGCDGFLADTQV
jgi:hypothetical protein